MKRYSPPSSALSPRIETRTLARHGEPRRCIGSVEHSIKRTRPTSTSISRTTRSTERAFGIALLLFVMAAAAGLLMAPAVWQALT